MLFKFLLKQNVSTGCNLSFIYFERRKKENKTIYICNKLVKNRYPHGNQYNNIYVEQMITKGNILHFYIFFSLQKFIFKMKWNNASVIIYIVAHNTYPVYNRLNRSKKNRPSLYRIATSAYKVEINDKNIVKNNRNVVKSVQLTTKKQKKMELKQE